MIELTFLTYTLLLKLHDSGIISFHTTNMMWGPIIIHPSGLPYFSVQ